MILRLRDLFLVILVTCIWGLNYVFVKMGLSTFPSIFFCALKFIVCSGIVAFLGFKTQLPWKLIVKMGIVLGTITFSLLYLGIEAGVPSGIASLLMQAQLIFTIILSALFLKDRCSWIEILGIAVACLGVFCITQHPSSETVSSLGFVLIIGAAFAGGMANIIVKRAGPINTVELIVWMSLVPPIPLLLLSYIFENRQIEALTSLSPMGGLCIFYGAIISTVLGYGLWGSLLKKYSPSTVAPFLLLVPVFGIIFSYLILDEQLSSVQLVSVCIVLAGLFTTMLGNRARLRTAS